MENTDGEEVALVKGGVLFYAWNSTANMFLTMVLK